MSKPGSDKYYAVREGRGMGVYNSWEQAREQVDRYSNAEHRSFKSPAGANEYMAGHDVYDNPRYYAVEKGHSTGVFDNWRDTRQATDFYSGSSFKRHGSEEGAQQWLASKGKK